MADPLTLSIVVSAVAAMSSVASFLVKELLARRELEPRQGDHELNLKLLETKIATLEAQRKRVTRLEQELALYGHSPELKAELDNARQQIRQQASEIATLTEELSEEEAGSHE